MKQIFEKTPSITSYDLFTDGAVGEHTCTIVHVVSDWRSIVWNLKSPDLVVKLCKWVRRAANESTHYSLRYSSEKKIIEISKVFNTSTLLIRSNMRIEYAIKFDQILFKLWDTSQSQSTIPKKRKLIIVWKIYYCNCSTELSRQFKWQMISYCLIIMWCADFMLIFLHMLN